MGKGSLMTQNTKTCPHCNGEGEVFEPLEEGVDKTYLHTFCDVCNGSGKLPKLQADTGVRPTSDNNVTAEVIKGYNQIKLMFGYRAEYWPIELAIAVADAINAAIAEHEEPIGLYESKAFGGDVVLNIYPRTEKALNWLKERGPSFGTLTHISYDGNSYGGGMWKLTLQPGGNVETIKKAIRGLHK